MTRKIRWSVYERQRWRLIIRDLAAGQPTPARYKRRQRFAARGWVYAPDFLAALAAAVKTFKPTGRIEIYPWNSDPHRIGREAMRRRGDWPFRRKGT